MTNHQLKIHLTHYERVKEGTKTFEVRFNDRQYQKGDQVTLVPWDGEKNEWIQDHLPLGPFVIGYVHPLENNQVAFSLIPLPPQPQVQPTPAPIATPHTHGGPPFAANGGNVVPIGKNKIKRGKKKS